MNRDWRILEPDGRDDQRIRLGENIRDVFVLCSTAQANAGVGDQTLNALYISGEFIHRAKNIEDCAVMGQAIEGVNQYMDALVFDQRTHISEANGALRRFRAGLVA